tara:strand:- start:15249 stop:15668 length:420 start_codon:yes stop_codon:yes gene_type:complete
MLELNSETFHKEANREGIFICIFYNKSKDNIQAIAPQVLVNNPQTICGSAGFLDVGNHPDIAQMFGINKEAPTILIMRNQIVLFCEPVSSFMDKYDITTTVEQVKKLDMKKIKSEIKTERESAAHIFGRRVCPTAKRSR